MSVSDGVEQQTVRRRLGSVDPTSFAQPGKHTAIYALLISAPIYFYQIVTKFPEEIITQHIDLDWTVNFDRKTISGSAIYTFRVVDAARPVSRIVCAGSNDCEFL